MIPQEAAITVLAFMFKTGWDSNTFYEGFPFMVAPFAFMRFVVEGCKASPVDVEFMTLGALQPFQD